MTPELAKIRDYHAAAVRLTADVMTKTPPVDLTRATPCAGWALADLLSHMIVQHRGFARAAGERTTVDDWQPAPVSDDPAGEFADSARVVIDAFADDAVADREIWLPELSAERPFRAHDALSFQLVDDVVHAWDLARTLDVPLPLDDDLAAAGLAVAKRVPNDPARRGPGFAFGPALEDTNAGRSGGTALDRTLRLLGRSPAWPN